MKLTYEYLRPTQKDHGHTNVLVGKKYVGYFMINRYEGGINFDVDPAITYKEFPLRDSFHVKNRKECIERIEKMFVILKKEKEENILQFISNLCYDKLCEDCGFSNEDLGICEFQSIPDSWNIEKIQKVIREMRK